MARNVVVKSTRNSQKAYRFVSNASTIADLKQEFTEAGIDYSGLSIIEAQSKVTYTADDQQLPVTIRKSDGSETSDLVFVLTNTQKNISSGLTRPELMTSFKEDTKLKDFVKNNYGKNYTNCSTDLLQAAYDAVNAKPETECKVEEDCNPKVSSPILITISTSTNVDFLKSVINAAVAALSNMIVVEPVEKEEIKCDYTAKELEELFNEYM